VRLLARFFHRFRRRRARVTELDERACYERLHATNGTEVHVKGRVEVAKGEVRRPRLLPRLSGEYLRKCFEQRLDSRESAHV
jgi:hypothetical protein